MRSFWYWISYSLSIIFHPVLIPTMIILCLFLNGFPMFSSAPIYVQMIIKLFLSTCIIPSAAVYFMYRLGFIQSLEMSDRKDRILPFVIISSLYTFVTLLYVISNETGLDFVLMMLAMTSSVVIVAGITTFHKISVHTVGMSGACGILLGLQLLYPMFDFMFLTLCFISLTGAVMSSRIYLNAHQPQEVITGFVVGFGVCFGIFWVVYLV